MKTQSKICIPEYKLLNTTVQTCSIYANDKYIIKVYMSNHSKKEESVQDIEVYKNCASVVAAFGGTTNELTESVLSDYMTKHDLASIYINEDDMYGSAQYVPRFAGDTNTPYYIKANSHIEDSIKYLREALTCIYNMSSNNANLKRLCSPYAFRDNSKHARLLAESKNTSFDISTNCYQPSTPMNFNITFNTDYCLGKWTDFTINHLLKNHYVIDKETGSITHTTGKSLVHIGTCDAHTLILNQAECHANNNDADFELYDLENTHSGSTKWAWIHDNSEFGLPCTAADFTNFKYIIGSLLENFELQEETESELEFWPDIIRAANAHFKTKK